MLSYQVLIGAGLLLLLVVVSALAPRSENNLWKTCAEKVSCLINQRNITDGEGRVR